MDGWMDGHLDPFHKVISEKFRRKSNNINKDNNLIFRSFRRTKLNYKIKLLSLIILLLIVFCIYQPWTYTAAPPPTERARTRTHPRVCRNRNFPRSTSRPASQAPCIVWCPLYCWYLQTRPSKKFQLLFPWQFDRHFVEKKLRNQQNVVGCRSLIRRTVIRIDRSHEK